VDSRILHDLNKILAVLTVAERRATPAVVPDMDAFVGLARDELVKAARRLSGWRRRPDGMTRIYWVAVEVATTGGVAFGCAYVASAMLELPRWLSALAIVGGQVALSFAWTWLLQRLDARLLTAPLPDWSATLTLPDGAAAVDVDVVLAQARGMIGQLAVERLGRVRVPVRSGRQARWVGQHDAFLEHLHQADACLSGAQSAWAGLGQGAAA
jgi:hypothetical protein